MKHTIVISQEELEELILEDLQRQGVPVKPEKGWLTWRSNGDHAGEVTVDLEVELPRKKGEGVAPQPVKIYEINPPPPKRTAAPPSPEFTELDPSMFPNPSEAKLLNEQLERMSRNENEDGTLYPGETPHRTQEAQTMADLLKGWPRGAGR